MTAKTLDRRLVIAAAAIVTAYLALAYALAPFAWRHYEHQKGLAALGQRTVTAQGIPGDVINIGLEGSEADVVCAMIAAGWSPSDPVTLASSLRIASSVVFHRPYHRAPVSPLFFEGRRQDLAFEKPSGRSASARHHVRFWKALETGDDGRPVWLGAATFDDGVGVSHYTGQITHHTAPDIDMERNYLMANLVGAKRVAETYEISGVGPTLFGRNGGGDPFFTDGEIAFARLAPDCKTNEGAPAEEPAPAKIAGKNALFSGLAALWRWLR